MNKRELRAFLDLMMCSDPWPVPKNHGHETLTRFANNEAFKHGFLDWIDAYHKLEV